MSPKGFINQRRKPMTYLDSMFISSTIQNKYAECIALEDIDDECPEYVKLIKDGDFMLWKLPT